MTEDEIADRIVLVLRRFVDRVRDRLSREVGGARFDGVDDHGVRAPFASFWLSDGDDELILVAYLRRADTGLECTADLGVYRETLSEMPRQILIDPGDEDQVEGLLKAFTAFVDAQEDEAVRVLQRDAGIHPADLP